MSRKKEYYEADFLEKQLNYYRSLPEKQRRHFLAMEYQRLGERSKRYLSRVFGCHWLTINKGVQELAANNKEFDKITDEDIKIVEEKLNNRPRKNLGYRTPNEVYFKEQEQLPKVTLAT